MINRYTNNDAGALALFTQQMAPRDEVTTQLRGNNDKRLSELKPTDAEAIMLMVLAAICVLLAVWGMCRKYQHYLTRPVNNTYGNITPAGHVASNGAATPTHTNKH
jgi:hypothetical protein